MVRLSRTRASSASVKSAAQPEPSMHAITALRWPSAVSAFWRAQS